MRTAVTGASGHLGANIVRALLAEGREVRALVRNDRRALAGLDVEQVNGDIFNPDSLCRLTRGVETVFHLAGRISIVGPEGGLVERTNVVGVRNVIDSCLKNGVRRLVHVSSIHAFSAYPKDLTIDESRALALGPHSMPYDRSKAQGQLAVLEAARKGLDAVIVNPAAVIGPFDYKPSRMGQVLLDISLRRLPALIDGGYDWVDARDVASGAIAAEKMGCQGECYLLSGHWVHIRDVSAMIRSLTGRKTPMWATPMWLALPASYASLAWGRLRGVVPKFTPAAVRTLQGHRLISHAKATEKLGFRPRPFEETVRDTLEWFGRAGMLEY